MPNAKILFACIVLSTISSCSPITKDWEKAQIANTIIAYQQFNKQYPNSEYKPQADDRIAKLKQQKTVKCQKLWEELYKSGIKDVEIVMEEGYRPANVPRFDISARNRKICTSLQSNGLWNNKSTYLLNVLIEVMYVPMRTAHVIGVGPNRTSVDLPPGMSMDSFVPPTFSSKSVRGEIPGSYAEDPSAFAPFITKMELRLNGSIDLCDCEDETLLFEKFLNEIKLIVSQGALSNYRH